MPHRHNQYRPKLVRSSGLLVIFLFVLAVPLMQNFIQTGSILGRTADISFQALIDSTNQQRSSHGTASLSANEKLTYAAQLKARDIFAGQYWAHTSEKGIEPWYWFEKADYDYSVAGENLAKNFNTADAVVAAWMNSPEHRKNLLDGRYNDVGFAIERGELQGKQTTVVVALYGTEKVSLSGVVSNTIAQPAVLAAQPKPLTMAARMGIGLQSLTPTALASVLLLLMISTVSLVAHFYRSKLPTPIRQSWRKHHGIYKAFAAVALGVFLVLLYGGGQI